MADDRPNVLFICTDQHRADCVGADPGCPTDRHGDPLVGTPTLDGLAGEGALFSRAYTPAPKCVPARRCLWTGRTPAAAGATTDTNAAWDFDAPLPRVLRDAGYQTHLAGKLHSSPPRNRIGFEGLDLHSGLAAVEEAGLDDYANWLDRQLDGAAAEASVGLGKNQIEGRPWHLAERLHPTVWTTDRAEAFLELRDPTRPFFLTVSYHRPHTPFDPPQAYWDQYIDRDLPAPAVGDWSREQFDAEGRLTERIRRSRAGYYGSVTHVDRQLWRLLRRLRKADEDRNTMIVMTADHGEMLGDHGLWRKSCGFEAAVRVPMIVRPPPAWDVGGRDIIDRPVGLQDVLPTVLDTADVDAPTSVEGRSLLDLFEAPDRGDWREFMHGEFSPEYDVEKACQYLVDEGTKYVWNPVTGREHYFDHAADPSETEDLRGDPAVAEALATARDHLAVELRDRPEGFVEDGALRTVDPDDWPALAG